MSNDNDDQQPTFLELLQSLAAYSRTDDTDDPFAGLGTPGVEPSAVAREMATTVYGQYTAFRQAGFNDDQAMTLILAMLHNTMNGGN